MIIKPCPVDLTKMTKKERDDFFDEMESPGEIRCLFDKNGNYVGELQFIVPALITVFSVLLITFVLITLTCHR